MYLSVTVHLVYPDRSQISDFRDSNAALSAIRLDVKLVVRKECHSDRFRYPESGDVFPRMLHPKAGIADESIFHGFAS